MADWRERLKDLFARPGRPRPEAVPVAEGRRRIERFLDETVLPAFEELARELETHGRTAAVERHPHMAVLTVYRAGHEEFSYAVRGRAYHKLSFAFPEHGDDDEPRLLKAEIVQSAGTGTADALEHFTREGIIRDFLHEYSRWMGWA